MIHLDLSSLKDIHRFVHIFSNRDLPPLRALVNNAGVQVVTGTTYTSDGFELTFGVNYLGHFLLTNLLLGMLKPPARIVNVSSEAHNPATSVGMPAPEYTNPFLLAKPDTLNTKSKKEETRTGMLRYATSKLCNVFFTYELSRRLGAAGYCEPEKMITTNAYAPGIVPGTGIGRDFNVFARFAWEYILPFFTFLPGVSSINQAGKILARLVLDPALKTITKTYFEGKHIKDSSKESHDEVKARELWEASIDLVQLKDFFF